MISSAEIPRPLQAIRGLYPVKQFRETTKPNPLRRGNILVCDRTKKEKKWTIIAKYLVLFPGFSLAGSVSCGPVKVLTEKYQRVFVLYSKEHTFYKHHIFLLGPGPGLGSVQMNGQRHWSLRPPWLIQTGVGPALIHGGGHTITPRLSMLNAAHQRGPVC